ncbi:hypothetical protein PENTCL1PPCAC_5526, partial [Pristionchus entomophagus]
PVISLDTASNEQSFYNIIRIRYNCINNASENTNDFRTVFYIQSGFGIIIFLCCSILNALSIKNIRNLRRTRPT